MKMHVTKKMGRGNTIRFALKIDSGTTINIKALNTDDSIASALRCVVAVVTAAEGRQAAKQVIQGLSNHLATLR